MFETCFTHLKENRLKSRFSNFSPQYADLDEFLSENGIPVDGLPSSHLGHSTSMGSGTTNRNDSLGHGLSLGLGTVTKRERSPSPSDCMSPDTINNPPSPADSSE